MPNKPNWTYLRAHTNNLRGEVDPLLRHLERVATMAAQFAGQFGGEEAARLAGILHDVGKVRPKFQDYLRRLEAGENIARGPQHAIWGAVLARALVKEAGWEQIALPVLGHHAGLRPRSDAELTIAEWFKENSQEFPEIQRLLKETGLLSQAKLTTRFGTSLEMFTRMVFSALTDADYLATEEHFDGTRSDARGGHRSITELLDRFRDQQQAFTSAPGRRTGDLNEARHEIHQQCVKAGQSRPGFFRLTVPTGTGKTRSGLAFALEHAKHNCQRRIFTVLPYTSITEQTAKVYREALYDDAILEHHSQFAAPETEGQSNAEMRWRAATENWDAPVVVTTTVQFFESLLSRRPGKARKLHNIARSVIILDEAQALPVELIRATSDVLGCLVREYGCTVVLCTATQPALEESPALAEFHGTVITEIVPDNARYFEILRRVDYDIRRTPQTWSEIADEIANQDQVMAILNTRRDAISLLNALPALDDTFHLSTLLCGAHRRDVLNTITHRLANKQRVKLISTQVVEAGVDLDFPLVFRASGPLDRIVQAAGRCNREGNPTNGKVVVFEPANGGQPSGAYRIGCELAKARLAECHGPELHQPAVYREYFRRLFSTANVDAKAVQERREVLDYPEVARRYRMIPETVSAIVDYGASQATLQEWQNKPSRVTWRKLQPFVVNFFQYEANRHVADGWLENLSGVLYRWLGKYDKSLRGVISDLTDPADLITGDWS